MLLRFDRGTKRRLELKIGLVKWLSHFAYPPQILQEGQNGEGIGDREMAKSYSSSGYIPNLGEAVVRAGRVQLIKL